MKLHMLHQALWRSFRVAFPNVIWFFASIFGTAILYLILLSSGFPRYAEHEGSSVLFAQCSS